VLLYIVSASDNLNVKLTKLKHSMIQIGWLVSDSLVILYVKAKIAIKWWSNTLSNVAIWQYVTQYGAEPYCYIPIIDKHILYNFCGKETSY